METKTWQEVANEIEKDKEINFIGRAISPLHILGIEAFILYLRSQGASIKGYILAVPHFETGSMLTEELFHTDLYENIEPIYLDGDNDLKTDIRNLISVTKRKSRNTNFYMVNPYRPAFSYVSEISKLRKEDRIITVITDEGNANYVSNPYRIRDNRHSSWGLKGLIRFTLDSCIRDRLLYKWFSSHDSLEHFLMLSRENGKWIPNRKCADCLIKVLKSGQIDDDYSAYEDSILICPSLLHDAGILRGFQDIEIYKMILDKLGSPKCVVKPHPREKDVDKYNKLECFVDRRYLISTEEILAHVGRKPRCIIGESSTILVSAAALFGIKAVSISKLINKEMLSDTHYFDKFNDIFSQMLIVPETKEELMKALEEL